MTFCFEFAIYNVCSGRGISIKQILEQLIEISQIKVKIVNDPNRMRPSDIPKVIGDNGKIRKLGWSPEIVLEKSLKDLLEYWQKML